MSSRRYYLFGLHSHIMVAIFWEYKNTNKIDLLTWPCHPWVSAMDSTIFEFGHARCLK